MQYTLTLIEQKQESADTLSFIFHADQPVEFEPGQYFQYTLEHQNPDNRGIKRYFSNAAAPEEGVFMITTRFAEKASSFKQALRALKPGQTILAEGPRGHFTYPDPHPPVVFIAGGIGITPFRSILMDLDAKHLNPEITLIYGNKTDDIPYKELLDELSAEHTNLKVHYVTGKLIDTTIIRQLVPDLTKPLFYVSGPEPMVDALGESIKNELQIPAERLKQDFFPGYEE